MSRTSPETETLAEHEQMMFRVAERAYFKAAETSDPQDWLQAGLMAQQHRNALTKLRGLAQTPEYWLAQAIDRFGPLPEGNSEHSRLIGAIHYAYAEGARAALADTSTDGHTRFCAIHTVGDCTCSVSSPDRADDKDLRELNEEIERMRAAVSSPIREAGK